MREKWGKVAHGHWNGNQVMGAQSLKINERKGIRGEGGRAGGGSECRGPARTMPRGERGGTKRK